MADIRDGRKIPIGERGTIFKPRQGGGVTGIGQALQHGGTGGHGIREQGAGTGGRRRGGKHAIATEGEAIGIGGQ